jgi:RimJ/RimL family protein N-acetyltransferase
LTVTSPRPRPTELRTARLVLRPSTLPLLRAELAGNDALATALGVVVPASWPPGEHNLHAVRYFLEHPELIADGWSDYYAIATATATTPATLVCSIGYQGLPSAAGRVEVGYSVVPEWRGRGIATEAVSALVARAQQYGLASVIGHARPDNAASIRVLTKSRFRPAPSTREGQLGFERPLYSVRRSRPSELAEINARYERIDFQPSKPDDVQLVAEHGGAISGLGRLVRITEGLLELGGIWVAEHLRGDGVARAIVLALIAASQEPAQAAPGGRAPDLACIPFARLAMFYGSCGFATWDPDLAPPAIRKKLEFCERTYAEPVMLMHRPGN